MIKTTGSSLATDQHSRLYRRIRGHSSDHAREYKKYCFLLLSSFFFFKNIQRIQNELLNSLHPFSCSQSRKQYSTRKRGNSEHTLPGWFQFGASGGRRSTDSSKFYFSRVRLRINFFPNSRHIFFSRKYSARTWTRWICDRWYATVREGGEGRKWIVKIRERSWQALLFLNGPPLRPASGEKYYKIGGDTSRVIDGNYSSTWF